jgi:hypothetical protein
MTSPRKTSIETSRGTGAGRKERFALMVTTAGELAAVTIPHRSHYVSIVGPSFHVSG